jgi:hypothetical protein
VEGNTVGRLNFMFCGCCSLGYRWFANGCRLPLLLISIRFFQSEFLNFIP